jgi:signal transduction histidine kinase
MKRLGIRHRLLLVVATAVAVALAALIVGFNLLLDHNLNREADNLVRGRAAAELGQLHTEGGAIAVGEAPDDAAGDSQVWVFAGRRMLEAPRSGPKVAAAARRLAGSSERRVDVPSVDTRLYAIPVVAEGRRLGTVVAGISLAPYEETRKIALISSLAFGGAVLVLVVLAARWLLAGSLRPVARMTRQAAVWSERDLDQRFALGRPRDELTLLAATLDGLLDRLAASLRREQRFSAELSHELRTPLSRVIAEAELALRRPRADDEYREALARIHRNAGEVARTVEALVAAARHEAGIARGTADAYAVAAGAADACAELAGERKLEVEVVRPVEPVRIGVDYDLAERILQPIVENACRYGRQTVRLSIQRSGSAVVFAVDDDGPGVAESERERIFDPGIRGHASAGREGGAGLGLSIARRLAQSAAGDIDADVDTSGRFLVRLPAG